MASIELAVLAVLVGRSAVAAPADPVAVGYKSASVVVAAVAWARAVIAPDSGPFDVVVID